MKKTKRTKDKIVTFRTYESLVRISKELKLNLSEELHRALTRIVSKEIKRISAFKFMRRKDELS